MVFQLQILKTKTKRQNDIVAPLVICFSAARTKLFFVSEVIIVVCVRVCSEVACLVNVSLCLSFSDSS